MTQARKGRREAPLALSTPGRRADRGQRLLGGRLLGFLLRAARARAELLAVDLGGAGEVAVVRRALDVEHDVRDAPARLARALPAARSCGRRGSCARTRSGRRRRRRSPPRSARSRARGRAPRSPPRAAPRCTFRLLTIRLSSSPASASPALRRAARPDRSSRATRGAALARDDVRADLRQPALGGIRVAVVELLGDRQLEHAVAEELQPLVRRRAVGRPRRVREDVLDPLARKRVDQAPELRRVAGRRRVTGASRRSRRPARRS